MKIAREVILERKYFANSKFAPHEKIMPAKKFKFLPIPKAFFL